MDVYNLKERGGRGKRRAGDGMTDCSLRATRPARPGNSGASSSLTKGQRLRCAFGGGQLGCPTACSSSLTVTPPVLLWRHPPPAAGDAPPAAGPRRRAAGAAVAGPGGGGHPGHGGRPGAEELRRGGAGATLLRPLGRVFGRLAGTQRGLLGAASLARRGCHSV